MSLNNILSISALVGYIKNKLTNDTVLRNVSVQGELGNFSSYKGSGHWYFTLKDNNAQIRCAMFRGYNNAVNFVPKEGDSLICTGSVNIYEQRGELQMVVTGMQLAGQGNFYAQFERTRKKLEPLGYFDPKYKKPIPAYPRQLSIVTGANTAALQDIRITVARRWPQVILKEVYAVVQGNTAVESIISALKQADNLGSDTIILARGGGSVDDLWCFNDESLAKAIFELKTPIVTGIGHEIDVTIADLVADERAATPTAAAQRATPDRNEVLTSINKMVSIMNQSMKSRYEYLAQTVDYYSGKLNLFSEKSRQLQLRLRNYESILASYGKQTENYRTVINNFEHIWYLTLSKRTDQLKDNVSYYKENLKNNTAHFLDLRKLRFSNLMNSLDNLSPLKVLSRGYSITSQNGNSIRSVDDVDMNEDAYVRLHDGILTVKPVERKKV